MPAKLIFSFLKLPHFSWPARTYIIPVCMISFVYNISRFWELEVHRYRPGKQASERKGHLNLDFCTILLSTCLWYYLLLTLYSRTWQQYKWSHWAGHVWGGTHLPSQANRSQVNKQIALRFTKTRFTFFSG